MTRDQSSQGGRPSGIAGGRIDVGNVTPMDGGPQPSAMRARRPSGIAGGRIDVGNVTPVDGGPQPSVMRADGTMAAEATIPVARFTEARG
ncbi:hypothetical protein AB0M64_18560 [Streptomyces sp. NPDC051771]|uniref:hypothetical protein n=1 Tax=Streptomyces sp. NPDC051771 TaxID=3154847 RepID=UPI00341D1FEA